MGDTKSARAIKLRNNIINKFVEEIRESSFYNVKFERAFKKCLQTITDGKIQQITCYGLGKIHGIYSVPPCYQLALLILIHEKLSKLNLLINTTIEMYDPRFDDLDLETFRAFEVPKFKILNENEHCCRRLEHHSNYHLFYMPHVDYPLYNNLLGVNWNPQDLGKLIILGNSFTETIETIHMCGCQHEFCYLLALVHNSNNMRPTGSKKGRKRRKMMTNEEETKDIEGGALVEFQVSNYFRGFDSAFTELTFNLISKDWLADVKNHTSLSKSKPSTWSPTIIVESPYSFVEP